MKCEMFLKNSTGFNEIILELNRFPGVLVKERMEVSRIIFIDYLGDNVDHFKRHFSFYGSLDFSRNQLCKR